jgi:hypothetical protein
MFSERKLESLLISALTAMVAFAVSFLKEMTNSVESLNQKIILVVERMARNDAQAIDHEQRLRKIEGGFYGPRFLPRRFQDGAGREAGGDRVPQGIDRSNAREDGGR